MVDRTALDNIIAAGGFVDIRTGSAAITGKLCVIGSKLDEKAIAALFGV